MNNEVLKYIVDLDNLKASRKHNAILLNGQEKQLDVESGLEYKVSRYEIDNLPIYTKAFTEDSTMSIAVSKMFNDVSIATPNVGVFRDVVGSNYLNASQDLKDIERKANLDIIEALDINEMRALKSKWRVFRDKDGKIVDPKWNIITNEELKEEMLSFMTEDCLDDLTAVALLEELVTYTDGCLCNWSMYKKPQSKKFEGVIPFDLEFYELLHSKKFEEFLQRKYNSFNPLSTCDPNKNYMERLYNIRKLYCSAKLTPNQVDKLKKALNYDLPKEIKSSGKKYGIKKHFKHAYEMTSRLWDYNLNSLGRDLGL